MSIVLVRHGETEGNATRVLQTADTPLNVCGLRQAEHTAERLAALGVAHILCSDFPRAQMTAAPLARRLGLEVELTPLLQERNFGDLRGTPYARLAQDPFGPDFVPPAGESWPVFHARVAEAFALVVARRQSLSGTLVVVTHGLVCRAILARHVPWPEGAQPPDRLDNASVCELEAEAPHRPGLVNCTAHLLGMDRPGTAAGGAA